MSNDPAHGAALECTSPTARPSGRPNPPAPPARVAERVEPPPDGLDDVLRAATTRHYAGDRTPDPALDAAVCAVVDALRADGLDVVAVLRAVKAQVTARGARPNRVIDDAVRCCIRRYYEGPVP